jgi:hypothetical protein
MVFIPFGLTSLVTLVVLCRYPRLWWVGLGPLATAAFVVLYLPVRGAFHRPSSFDSQGDAIGLAAEFLMVAGLVGLLHHGLFLVLLVAAIEAHDRALTQKECSGSP